MSKAEELTRAGKAVEEAKRALFYANMVLKNIGDNEGSLLGQGVLRNVEKYNDYIVCSYQIALEEQKKNETK